MILESGAQTVARVLGRDDRPSGPHGQDRFDPGRGGVRFDVSDLRDVSIGAAPDPSKV
jgi:hypothetical protein